MGSTRRVGNRVSSARPCVADSLPGCPQGLLKLPSARRDIFPTGLPEQFSFVCTFRARKVPKASWHLLRVAGAAGDTQLAVQLNPRRESVELQLVDYQGQLQTIAFTNAVVRLGPRVVVHWQRAPLTRPLCAERVRQELAQGPFRCLPGPRRAVRGL